MDGGGDKSATSGCRYSKSPIHVVVAVSITIIIIIPSQCTNSPIPSSLSGHVHKYLHTYYARLATWVKFVFAIQFVGADRQQLFTCYSSANAFWDTPTIYTLPTDC